MTATTVDLHPAPSLGDVFQAHFRTLYFTLRRVRWLLVIALVLFAVGQISIARIMKREVNSVTQTAPGKTMTTTVTIEHGIFMQRTAVTPLSPQETVAETADMQAATAWEQTSTTIIGIVLIAMFAFRVWRAEPPSRRMYFLSMPMPRGDHALVKTVAGWCWLVIGIVVLMVVGLIEYGAMLTYVGAWHSTMQMLDEVLHTTFLLQRVVGPLLMATVLYILLSALVIGVDSPGYWLAGIGIGFMVIPAICKFLDQEPVSDAILSVWRGRYGLSAIAPVSGFGSWDVTHWWAVTGLWFAIGLVAVTGAAYARRP